MNKIISDEAYFKLNPIKRKKFIKGSRVDDALLNQWQDLLRK